MITAHSTFSYPRTSWMLIKLIRSSILFNLFFIQCGCWLWCPHLDWTYPNHTCRHLHFDWSNPHFHYCFMSRLLSVKFAFFPCWTSRRGWWLWWGWESSTGWRVAGVHHVIGFWTSAETGWVVNGQEVVIPKPNMGGWMEAPSHKARVFIAVPPWHGELFQMPGTQDFLLGKDPLVRLIRWCFL